MVLFSTDVFFWSIFFRCEHLVNENWFQFPKYMKCCDFSFFEKCAICVNDARFSSAVTHKYMSLTLVSHSKTIFTNEVSMQNSTKRRCSF